MQSLLLILPLLLFAAFGNAQLKLTYNLKAAADAGMRVLTFNDVGFQDELGTILGNKQSRPVDLGAVVSLAVIVKNTGRATAGYVNVRYRYTLKSGQITEGDITVNRNLLTGDAFKPGQVYLIWPGMSGAGDHITVGDSHRVEHLGILMSNCAAIDVTVDAIQVGGKIFGPDRGAIRGTYGSERAAVSDALAESRGEHRIGRLDENYTWARRRLANLSPGALEELLAGFAPLEGELQ